MNALPALWVQGIGAWSPGLPDWHAWRGLLRGEAEPDESAPAKPKPERLAASERRRVSTHVLAAIEVADQAVAMSGIEAGELPCVFASAHGDAGIMDYMCAVLADTPQHLSPTRFHNSVHNAPVGYWTIATGCHAATNAVAAFDCTFGAALLEAAALALAEDHPVLLVANDEPGGGPLGEVRDTTRPFACALVLSPHANEPAIARLELALSEKSVAPGQLHQAHAQAMLDANPSAHGLPLLEALARNQAASICLAATPGLGLDIRVEP